MAGIRVVPVAAAAAAPAPAAAGDSGIRSYDLLPSGMLLKHKGLSRYLFPNGVTFSDYIKTKAYVGSHEFPPGYSGKAYLIEIPMPGSEPPQAYQYVLKHITNPAAFEHVLEEVEMLARVSNKWFAVQLYSAQIMPDGSAYLLFPYILGKDFMTFVEEVDAKAAPTREDKLKLRQIYNIMLEAIGEIHKLGIIHRDVKFENFYLPDDPDIPPFFLDFGLSAPASNAVLTEGTANYVRPERWGQVRKPTPNDNYYALGVMYNGSFAPIVGDRRVAMLKREGITNAEAQTLKVGGRRRNRNKKITRRHKRK